MDTNEGSQEDHTSPEKPTVQNTVITGHVQDAASQLESQNGWFNNWLNKYADNACHYQNHKGKLGALR
jgi:hypothetical protein